MSHPSIKLERIRPWYRLHAATVMVAIAMIGFLAAASGSSFRRMDGLVGLYQNGWPFAFFRRHDDHLIDFHGFGIPLNQPDEFFVGSLIGDIAIASAIMAAVTALAERRIRRKGRLAQFSLREMLALVAVVGVVMGHEMSVQRRQREAVDQLFQSRHNYFGADEGLPHRLRYYLPDRS
jgi:hypothetical protein